MMRNENNGRSETKTPAHNPDFFQFVVENVRHYAIFATDPEGVIVSWNPGVEQLLGYAESEFVGQHISLIFTPEDVAAGAPKRETASAETRGKGEDLRWHVRRDGSRFWANGLVMPLEEAGELRGFVKILRDDTPRKMMELALREKEELYGNIVRNFPNGAVFVFDRDARYVVAGGRALADIGLTPPLDELAGQTVAEIFPPATSREFERDVRRALDGRSGQRRFEHDGRVFEVHHQPIRIDEREISWAMLMAQDVTERERRAAEIENSRAETRRILESITDAFFSLDREWRFTYVNREAEKLLLRRADELLGKSVWDEFPEAVGSTFYEEYHRAVESGATVSFEEYYPPLESWFDVRAYPSADGLSVYFHNVNERREAERALRESEEKYRVLFNSIDEGFCVLEMHFDEQNKPYDWRFLQVNPAFEKHNGLRQAVGKTILELVPNIEHRWFEIYGRVAVTGESTRLIEYSEALGRWFDLYAFRLGAPEERRVAVLFNDVTERRAGEEALARSAARLRLALEGGGMGWWNYDPRTNRSEPDEKCLALFGIKAENYGGDADELLRVIHPEDREAVRNALVEAIAEQGVYQIEFRVVLPDGAIRWLAGLGSGLYDAHGNPLEVYGVNFDITERRQSEAALRESEEKFRTLADHMSQFAWMADPTGSIFWYNRRWFEYTGTTLDEMRGWGWQKVHHPDHVDRVREHFKRSVEAGETWEDIFPLRSAAGEYRWFLSRAVAIRDRDGRIERWFGTNTDITEQKQSEEKLRASEERFRSLQQATPDGFMIFESVRGARGAIGDFRWLYVNPAAEKIVGRSERELTGKLLLEEMPGNREDGLFAAYVKVVETGEVWRNEFSYRHENLDHHFLSTAVKTGDGFAVAFSDITERRRNEIEREELLAKEQAARAEAEAATRAKDEFLAVVTHELRSPLNSILGWNTMLKNQPSPEMLARVTEIIERQGKQQLQLIEDLLDTARIVSGKMAIEQEPVDLASVITAALDIVRPSAQSKGVALALIIDSRREIVTGDAERLQQVVWNLLSNAVKFTPAGGRVEIELRRENSSAVVEVRDTGKGIEPSFLPFVFERFSQADSSKSRRFGGLGLGLALVRQLTELHGGTVAVSSDGEGRGAVFTVRLPIRAVTVVDAGAGPNGEGWHENPTAQAGPASGTLSGARILVADDLPDARELVRFTLERHGARVDAFESGAQALAALGPGAVDANFDLFICDIGMPDEDGYTVIKKLRALEEERGGNLPAIALTAFTGLADKTRALESGFQMHIGKPVEPDELTLVVASLLTVKKFI